MILATRGLWSEVLQLVLMVWLGYLLLNSPSLMSLRAGCGSSLFLRPGRVSLIVSSGRGEIGVGSPGIKIM